MELDDFKNTWNEMDNQVKSNPNIDLSTFNTMSKKKFQSGLKKIVVPEILGSLVCIGCAIFIGFNFYKLNTLAFQITGVLALVLLLVLPVLSIMSIWQLYKAGDITKSYAENLKTFTLQKIQFCKLQKLNATLSYLLLVTVIMLVTKLFGKNSITESNYFWTTAFGLGYIFMLGAIKWVAKFYNKTIAQAENLLQELPE